MVAVERDQLPDFLGGGGGPTGGVEMTGMLGIPGAEPVAEGLAGTLLQLEQEEKERAVEQSRTGRRESLSIENPERSIVR